MRSHKARKEHSLVVANKGSRKTQQHKSHKPNTAGEFFKGVGFSVRPHRPEMY